MNNYCKYLKKRKNKPYCKLINKEIKLSLCKECGDKEYKKISANLCKQLQCIKRKKSDFRSKSPSMTGLSNNGQMGKNSQSLEKITFKRVKMRNKSNKLTVTKETYNFVIERDNYSCRLCGSTNWLQLHHVLYRSQRRDLINNIDNCIMLCEECHRLVHSNKKKWQPILIKMAKDTTQQQR